MRWILVILLFAGLPGNAQKIHFTDSLNEWTNPNYHYDGIVATWTNDEINRYTSDTLCFGHLYRSLETMRGKLLIREDTMAGTIYFRFTKPVYNLDSTDAAEHLFFDYNLGIGDTLKIDFKNAHYRNRVAAITTVDISGTSHRVWKMVPVESQSIYFTFIEGIGSVQGTAWHVSQRHWEAWAQLHCFSNGAGPGIINPPIYLGPTGTVIANGRPLIEEYDNYHSCGIDVSVENVLKPVTIQIPNPVRYRTTVLLPASLNDAELIIVNSAGQIAARIKAENRTTIQIGEYLPQPGLYYYRIRTGEGLSQTGTLMRVDD